MLEINNTKNMPVYNDINNEPAKRLKSRRPPI